MKTIYRLLAGFLGLVFTVAGCSDDDATEYGPPTQVEYGVPRADFRISGQVIDEVSGQGVPGFEVTFSDDLADTTDAQGFWRIEGESVPLRPGVQRPAPGHRWARQRQLPASCRAP